MVLSSENDLGASAIGSGGNIIVAIEPVLSPAWIASVFIDRFTPHSPPTPVSVKPNDSWIGANVAEMMMRNE